jgi:mono/diheme cytochrome c family protein
MRAIHDLSALALALLPALTAAAAETPAASPPAGEPEPAPFAVMFGKKCGSCHTLGEGDRTGPDLLGATTRRQGPWLRDFIRAPGAKIDAGDPVANELLRKFKDVRMPDQPFTDAELDGILAYIAECTAKGGCRLVLGKVKHASEATAADVARGRRIFAGSEPLQAGGPACLSCHNVRGAGLIGGGTLAKDLTFVYARLGDAGVTSSLEATPFPLMKDIYVRRPLAADEAFALKAYFADAAKDGTPPAGDSNFLYLGFVGLCASLGTIGAIWHGRLRGVRKTIVNKRGAR